jgi:hypothetical protein
LSYFDTRLGIGNNIGASATPAFGSATDFALNSIFSNALNSIQQFGGGTHSEDNSGLQASLSNPFSFGSGGSFGFPSFDFGSLFSNLSGNLSSGFPSLNGNWGVGGSSNNTGPVNIPPYASRNNINKIKELDPLMQQAVVELMEYAHAEGIPFEISEGYCPAEVRKARRDKAIAEGNGREAFYAHDGKSKHIFRKAIDLDRKVTSPENLKRLGQKWTAMQCEWGGRWKDTDHSKTELWHFALEAQGQATRYKPSGNNSAVAGGGSSSPWGGGFDFSMPSFGGGMNFSFPTSFGGFGGFGGGFGGSWFNTTFSSSLGGWGGGYQGGGSSTRALPSQYQDKVQKYSDTYGADARLISAMLDRESSGDPNATSSAGARGLMQLMPGTARQLGVTNITDPDQNISGGIRYITKLIKRYNGDVRTGLAAYNSGPVEINNLVKRYGTTDYNVIGPHVNGQTQEYVRRVMRLYNSSGGGGGQHLNA